MTSIIGSSCICAVTDPSGVRISVNGDILSLKEPRSTWARHFGKAFPVRHSFPAPSCAALTLVPQEAELAPLRRASDTLSAVGKNPVKKAVVVSLPTIESAFVTHTAKGIQGWDHPDYPVLRVVIEVLNATESFLWVRNLGASSGIVLSAVRRGTSVALDWRMARTARSTWRLASSASRSTGCVNIYMCLTLY